LRLWLKHELPAWFGERILPACQGADEGWGMLMTQVQHTTCAMDDLLGATALHHGLRLVTRNETDFRFAGLEVITHGSADERASAAPRLLYRRSNRGATR
jgi:predicted nucleic acid-binding protein